MTLLARILFVLGITAVTLGAAPTWNSTEFFATKRVRELSIGVLRLPLVEVREVDVRASSDANEWTRLDRRVDWELLGPSAFMLMAGCLSLAAAWIARRRWSALTRETLR